MAESRITTIPYRRPFAIPLQAAWGSWSIREGFLVRITDSEGNTGYGEVAPLPLFGSETVAQAEAFLRGLPEAAEIEQIRHGLQGAPPASGFGIWSALEQLGAGIDAGKPVQSTALLPEGNRMVAMMNARSAGYRTYKLKLGLHKPEQEWDQLQDLLGGMSKLERLRLDPNRSWNLAAFEFWIGRLEKVKSQIEFIEEPFLPGEIPPDRLLGLAADSAIPLALDESICEDGWKTWAQREWPGFWILKPSLAGVPNWIEGLDPFTNKIIISSAFETAIGMNHLVHLARAYPGVDHGLGTGSFFNDAFGLDATAKMTCPRKDDLHRIWEHLHTN